LISGRSVAVVTMTYPYDVVLSSGCIERTIPPSPVIRDSRGVESINTFYFLLSSFQFLDSRERVLLRYAYLGAILRSPVQSQQHILRARDIAPIGGNPIKTINLDTTSAELRLQLARVL
jgi:hypothetical protein